MIMDITSLSHKHFFSTNIPTYSTKDQWVMQKCQAVILTNSWNMKASISLPLLRQKCTTIQSISLKWKNVSKNSDKGFLALGLQC